MNKVIKTTLRLASQSPLLPFLEHREAQRKNRLRIITYHRIGHPGTESGLLDPTLLSATPDGFEQQMRFLVENYYLVSIRDVLLATEKHTTLPAKSVLVTFDDGYRNFLDTAWPVLKRYQVPALLFLPTGFISSADRLFWWDRLYQGISTTSNTSIILANIGIYSLENSDLRWKAFIQLKKKISRLDYHLAMTLVEAILSDLKVVPQTRGVLLNWDDVRLLSEEGCYLASHTRNHPIVSRISWQEAKWEVDAGQQDIAREIGHTWPVFAYPSGHVQDIGNTLPLILGDAGFTIAMTSMRGVNALPKANLLLLKRIDSSPNLELGEFRLVLAAS